MRLLIPAPGHHFKIKFLIFDFSRQGAELRRADKRNLR
jgi:hypothetical protein